MAAPLGFKTFATGDVLTAGDTNGYLMQGVLVFANAAARTAAITSPEEGQTSYLKDTGTIQVYSGSAWVTKSAGAATTGPGFQVYRGGSNQSVSSSVWTKIQLNTEEYDTDNCFDSTTNYRFTPTTAGKYVFGYAMNTNVGTISWALYKNGSLYKYFPMGAGSMTASMNGTTDYIEFYVYVTGSSPVLYSGSDSNSAYGAYLRS